MSDQTEVEITGALDPQQLATVHAIEASASQVVRLDRYMINFTTKELRESHVDLRARITNGSVELMIKHGEWGTGVRTESPVQCASGQFVPLVKALNGLGYVKGIGCHRIITRFMSGPIEVSLIEVPEYAWFFEAELLVASSDAEQARRQLLDWAEEHRLPVLDKDAYLRFIADLDAHANDDLDFRLQAAWETLSRRIRT